MAERGAEGGAAMGACHVDGGERDACVTCDGVSLAGGWWWRQLPEAVQRTTGGEVCVLPPALWEPLVGKRRPCPSPPRRIS